MMSRKLVRSSIILILMAQPLSSESWSIHLLGKLQKSGPDHRRQPSEGTGGLDLEYYAPSTPEPGFRILLEKGRHPLSARMQWPYLHLSGGSRFRPGPPTGFYVKEEGRSYLRNLPDRSHRPMAFLSIPVLTAPSGKSQPGEKNTPSSPAGTTRRNEIQKGEQIQRRSIPLLQIGGGHVAGSPHSGFLLGWKENLTLFYIPGNQTGYFSWSLRREDGEGKQSTYGSVYSDDRGRAGFARFSFSSEDYHLQLDGSRKARRDLNPLNSRPYPGRKGKSGRGSIRLLLPFAEITTAGEDRGRDQYRLIRARALPPLQGKLRFLFHARAARHRIYGSDAGTRHFRSYGLGLTYGKRLEQEQRSLSPDFRAMLLLQSNGASLSAELSAGYYRGGFWLQAGYRRAHAEDPFTSFSGHTDRDPAVSLYRNLWQVFRIRAGTEQMYLGLIYMETLDRDRDHGKPGPFYSVQIHGRWKL